MKGQRGGSAERRDLKKYVGKVSREDSDAVAKAVEEGRKEDAMPVISRFYGMVVKMYFAAAEHNPPHFHVVYGECSGVYDLDSLNMTEGDLPEKAQSLVREWAEQHKAELRKIWDTQQFQSIPPLV